MNNGVKGNGNDNKFFTMEFFGVTLIISSFLLAVCLLFGNSVIYLIGGEVQQFLLGVFGYLAYPFLLIVNYLGFMAFFGKKPVNKNAVKPLVMVTLFLVSFLSFLNVLTTSTTASTYSEYLTNAYASGKNGLSGVCAGGVIISLITYPFVKFLTKLGAIISLAIITILIIYFAIKFRSSLYVKISGVRDYPAGFNAKPNSSEERDNNSKSNSGNFIEVNVPNRNLEPNRFVNSQPTPNPYQNYNGYNNGANYNGYNNPNSYNGYNNVSNQYDNRENQYNVDRENAMRILYGTPPTYSQSYNNSFYSEQSHYPPNVNQVKPSVDGNMISNPIKKEFTPPEFTEVDNSYNNEVPSSKIFDDSNSYSDEFEDDVLNPPQNVSSFFEKQDNNDNFIADTSEIAENETLDESEDVVENVDNSGKRIIENMPLNYKYNAPPISLFKTIDNTQNNYEIEVFKAEVKERILSTLERFGVKTSIARVYRGPAVTRFDIEIPPDVPLSKVTSRQNDLNLRIAAKSAIRMIAPIPNTSYVGIEVPNSTMDSVSIKDIISSEDFLNSKPFSLTFALGKDVIGKPVSLDIADMPHLLVTGTTGSG
ncbi:MAG: DNA translocase FtsK, partial [Clostridia bacterium]|nr:DNA translocase FtsK [Clostridia bacterium]